MKMINKTNDKDNQNMLDVIEGKNVWKQCVNCERAFDRYTKTCIYCGEANFMYGITDDTGRTIFRKIK